MKNHLVFFLLLIAQSAQSQIIEIKGVQFQLVLNESDKTAAIRDNDYIVDDRKYPVDITYRKFKGMANESIRTITVPSTYKSSDDKRYTITTIGRAAFAGFDNVDNIVLPSTITTIEDYAFFRSSVVNIEIPASVTQIGNRVFGHCKKLRNLTLPLGVEVSPNIYSESKNIAVKYQLDEDLAKAVANRSSVKGDDGYALTSDVDEDIPILSQTNKEAFAVIIANENYKKVAKVNCAHNDGRAFRRYCENVLGIPVENIHYIEDATLGNMTAELNWLSRVAKAYEGESSLIIYYAGHGIPNEKNGAGYLLPVDVAGNDISAAYSLNTLYSLLGGLNAKYITLFMDACFSGSLRGDGMLMSARGVAIKARPEDPLGNMIVFSAAQGDETAYPYPEKGHGLFTYYLLKKLKETKGKVSLGELGDYVRKEVVRKSAVVNSKSQTPTVSYSSKMNDEWRNISLK